MPDKWHSVKCAEEGEKTPRAGCSTLATAMSESRSTWNGARFRKGSKAGHYESWFQRANHPSRPLAFWIRYTIFVPSGGGEAEGELWAVHFDGETDSISAVKRELSIAECRFAPSELKASIGDAELDSSSLEGAIEGNGQRIEWSLDFTSPRAPLLLLPRSLYRGSFPKAKALVGSPNAVYTGSLTVAGERIAIDGWVGSQNHNWGSRHTDRYAWGQVAEFDDAPGSFLEIGTARLKLGPLWTPPMTVMALRLDGREHRLSSIPQSLRASGKYGYFDWEFSSAIKDISIAGTISASGDAFVALPYRNPPGGLKTCLNSKIAGCEIVVRQAGQAPRTLVSKHRAGFEILTDDAHHGVPVMSIEGGIGGLGRGRFGEPASSTQSVTQASAAVSDVSGKTSS